MNRRVVIAIAAFLTVVFGFIVYDAYRMKPETIKYYKYENNPKGPETLGYS